ncbi:hypothetical protein BCR33DRAFT_710893 [Rhizoclosmatium globosum]|uniref:CID domain-containing protein n=1 Tax=Rhizoclosmatium globosum TaxID=329046 RepID=A0A1Y2D2E8_9FUNG|nr:hypothetical protein BCR33DRAFT_710893 [Rhizoclosmatium globosum]|eukprot:ORY53473.1 hypothetical protein BCR33DRAFT_710893 [Rhizoclosmatium globosum]
MDSICKNVGPVYTRLFANDLVASFSNAYAAVSPEDRERFRKVVNTWKLPDVKTGGRAPLFDPALTRNLDTFMNNYRDGNNGAALNTGNCTTPPNQSLTSIVLQQQIQALLTQKQQAVLLNPQDTASRSQIPVLTQLISHPSRHDGNHKLPHSNTIITPCLTPKSMPGLLEGFNSKSSTQTSTTSSTTSSKKEATLPRLSLSNADINKPLPNAHLILYDPSTNQCAQCGTRFPGTTDAGKKKYSAHLDWHFRQNKRLRENTRRRVCREWWLASDVWVSEDLTGNLEVDEDKSCESMSDPGCPFF